MSKIIRLQKVNRPAEDFDEPGLALMGMLWETKQRGVL
jgi:hypothetical protein